CPWLGRPVAAGMLPTDPLITTGATASVLGVAPTRAASASAMVRSRFFISIVLQEHDQDDLDRLHARTGRTDVAPDQVALGDARRGEGIARLERGRVGGDRGWRGEDRGAVLGQIEGEPAADGIRLGDRLPFDDFPGEGRDPGPEGVGAVAQVRAGSQLKSTNKCKKSICAGVINGAR